MQSTPANFKLIKKIRDDRFEEDHIHQYSLFIHLGLRDLQVAVVDTKDDRILLLEDYVFPNPVVGDELISVLDQLFESHAFLKAGFWKEIKVSVKNNKFVQVPEALFVEGAENEYLRFNAQVDDDEELMHIANSRTKAVTVFAVPSKLRGWFTNMYGNNTPVFMHQSSALIEGISELADHKKNSPLYIYVDRFKLHIISCQDQNLLYYNQFGIKQFSDYIRYIMLVMKSLNMNQATSQILLWGYVGKNSPHYHEFYKYINNVIFGHRPDYLNFGYMFDEVQDHHFFDLYSMHLLGNKN